MRFNPCTAAVLCTLTAAACGDPGLDVDSGYAAIEIASPTAHQVLSSSVTLTAMVSGTNPVTGVRFTIDGFLLGGPAYQPPPFEFVFDTRTWPNSSYALVAEALTADGSRVKSLPVPVTIVNTGAVQIHVTVPAGAEGPGEASTVMIDGLAVGRISSTGGSYEADRLEPGWHTIDLAQIRYDCTTIPGAATEVDVVADETQVLELEVECAQIPNLTVGFEANGDIYRSRLDGSQLVNLTNTAGRREHSPDWSPDASHVAYVAGDVIFVSDREGLSESALVSSEGPKTAPRWSPDGSEILLGEDVFASTWTAADDCWYGFCDLYRLFVIQTDGGARRTLTTVDGWFGDLPGGWSADGARVTYERSYLNGSCALYVMDADLPQSPELVRPILTGCGGDHPSWRSDGQIAFSIRGVRGRDLALVGADGTGLTALPATPGADEHDPVWTEDGQWLLFLDGDRITLTTPDGLGRFRANVGFHASSFVLLD